jgi:hypothetical protein
MSKPLVFISHSAKETLTKEVLAKVVAQLKPDFEVLLDQDRLEANDPWRKELDIWMSLCNVAIILFSEAALKSDWVLKETTILRWRRALDERFIIVPVLFPPVAHKTLDENEKFAPLALNEIQMLTAETADTIVERIVERLAPLKGTGNKKTALQQLESLIASKLSELETRNPQALQDAATELNLPLGWRSDKKYSEDLARSLLSADFALVAAAILVLAPHFNDPGTALQIIDWLSPFWVDVHAVARLPELIKSPQKKRAICVNGIYFHFTPKSYLSRARADIYPWVSATVIAPRGYEENPQLQAQMIEAEIARQVLPLLGLDEGGEDLFSEDADRETAAKELTEPLFIVVPKELKDEVLEGLRDKFFRFSFFLLREDKALEPTKLKLQCIELLEPKLDPATEASVARLYFDTRGKVNSLKTR